MTTIYLITNEKSYSAWEYANYLHSDYDETTLFDLLETYWDYPLQEIWSSFPIRLQINEEDIQLPIPNLQLFSPEIPLFDGTAKNHLEKSLSSFGEFLPLYNNDQEIYFYHLVQKVPALDLEQSIVRRYQSSGLIAHITKYVFQLELVKNQYIFQIPEAPGRLFVTNRFVQFIKTYQLTGLVFHPIWQA